jgi:hypothetical protein
VLPEDSTQFASQKIRFPASRPDHVSYRLNAHHSKASSVWTTRTFSPNLPLCLEVLNCSSLHPSGRFSNTFGRLSVFDQLQDFFPKHRYGKIAATVWKTWTSVRTRSSIRQVSQFKSRRPDSSQHGPDARALDMKIACIKSTVGRPFPWSGHTKPLYGNYLQRKCDRLDNRASPSRRGSETRKNFSKILGQLIA